jgi:hypothetical protein
MRGFLGTTPYKPIGKQRKCPLILLDLALGLIGHSGSLVAVSSHMKSFLLVESFRSISGFSRKTAFNSEL